MKKSEARLLMDGLEGRTVHGLRLVKILGVGATAAVYKAVNDSDESFALKLYEAQFADSERLERELTLKGHDCPHLVKVFDGGKTTVDGKDIPFLVMEFVEGQELTRLRDRKTPIPDAEVRRILRELCVACQYLLKRGVLHRDVKTQNIKLRTNNQVVLLDMGVVRPLGDSDLTQEGRNVATRRYSPPELQHRTEQCDPAGFEAITAYQVGAVLYELIQRTKLFANIPDHPDATLSRAVDTEIPRFVGASVGADLCEMALRCLAKDWEVRPKLEEILSLTVAAEQGESSLLLTRRQRGRRAAAEISAARAEAEAHLSSLSDAVKSAVAVVKESLAMLGPPSPNIEVIAPTRILGTLVVGHFPESIEDGIPATLLVVVELTARPRDSAVVARGCGIFGSSFMPSAKQVPQVFSKQPKGAGQGRVRSAEVEDALEPLWSLPFDQETFARKLVPWMKSLMEEYFRLTEDYFEQVVEYHKAVAEAKRRGERLGNSPRILSPGLFNTTTQRRLGARDWSRVR